MRFYVLSICRRARYARRLVTWRAALWLPAAPIAVCFLIGIAGLLVWAQRSLLVNDSRCSAWLVVRDGAPALSRQGDSLYVHWVRSNPAGAAAGGVLGFVANRVVTAGAIAADVDEVSRQSEHHHQDDG
jgi:hypothetical protein